MIKWVLCSLLVWGQIGIGFGQDAYQKALKQKNKKQATIEGDKWLNNVILKNGIYNSETANTLLTLIEGSQTLEDINSEQQYTELLQHIHQYKYSDTTKIAALDYNAMAMIYYKNKNYADAACSFDKAFAVYRNLNKGDNTIDAADALNQSAICYDMLNDYDNAEARYKMALLVYKELVQSYSQIEKNIYRSLIRIYEKTGNKEKLNAIMAESNMPSMATTQTVKPEEKCDCIKKLIPPEELRKLGIEP